MYRDRLEVVALPIYYLAQGFPLLLGGRTTLTVEAYIGSFLLLDLISEDLFRLEHLELNWHRREFSKPLSQKQLEQ